MKALQWKMTECSADYRWLSFYWIIPLISLRLLYSNGEKSLFPVIAFCSHMKYTLLLLITEKHIQFYFHFTFLQRMKDNRNQRANTTWNQKPADLIQFKNIGDLKWTIFVTRGVMKSWQHEMEFFYHYKQVTRFWVTSYDWDWLLEAEPQIFVTEEERVYFD